MKQEKTQPKLSQSNTSIIVFWIISIATTGFLCLAFFYWTVVPYMQSGEYLTNQRYLMSTGDSSVLINDQFVFDPDSNVQGILRSDFLRQVSGQASSKKDSSILPLLDKSIAEMEEYNSNHPDYYTYMLALANGYSAKAQLTNDPKYYEKSGEIYKRAMQVVKNRQDIVYSYAMDLVRQNKGTDAIVLLKNLIQNDPETYASYYNLGEIYLFIDENHQQEALNNFEISLSHGTNVNNDFTKNAYQRFLKYFYDKGDITNFSTVVNRLAEIDQSQKYAYLGVIDYLKQNNKIPKLNMGSGK